MNYPEILTILGVIVPAFGSLAMYSWNLAIQRRKSTRRVLFFYLEFWNYVRKQIQEEHPMGMAQAYFHEVTTYMANTYPEAGDLKGNENRELVDALLKQSRDDFGNAIDDDFIEHYKSSLTALSEDFPVLAYALNGREKLPEMFRKIYEYSETIKALDEVKSSNEPTQDYVDWISRKAMHDHLTECNNTVSGDLLLIARECGWTTYFKVRKMVREPIPDLMEEFRPKLHQFIDTAMAEMARRNGVPIMTKTK